MTFSNAMKTLGVSALVFTVSGCEYLDFTGNDTRLKRIEVSSQECQERGGVTVVASSGEQICRIDADNYNEAVAGAPAVAAAASSSATGAGTAAAVAGLGLVMVLAVSDSASGTR